MSDPAGSRPAKRVKGEEKVAEPVYTRSDVWFDDGNLVIEAGGVIFRVHKSVLVAHSMVFRDILAKEPSGETLDGCPLVHLSDDHRELKHVFKALYGDASYFKADVKMEFIAAAAFLNLGTKYHILHLPDEARLRIAADFPSTLQAYQNPRPWMLTHHTLSLGMDVIALAGRHNLRTLLPAAFYRVATEKAHKIVLYIQRQDGTSAVLSPHNQSICLKAKDQIHEHQGKYHYGWLDTKGSDCSTPEPCRMARDSAARKAPSLVLAVNSLQRWNVLWGDVDLCESCKQVAITRYEQYRADFWEKLPGFCGLGSWAELKAGGGA